MHCHCLAVASASDVQARPKGSHHPNTHNPNVASGARPFQIFSFLPHLPSKHPHRLAIPKSQSSHPSCAESSASVHQGVRLTRQSAILRTGLTATHRQAAAGHPTSHITTPSPPTHVRRASAHSAPPHVRVSLLPTACRQGTRPQAIVATAPWSMPRASTRTRQLD